MWSSVVVLTIISGFVDFNGSFYGWSCHSPIPNICCPRRSTTEGVANFTSLCSLIYSDVEFRWIDTATSKLTRKVVVSETIKRDANYQQHYFFSLLAIVLFSSAQLFQ